MKYQFGLKFPAVAGACLAATLISLPPARAQEFHERFYVHGDLGGEWTRDTDLKEFFGPVTPGSKVKFDPGIRFGVAAGYNVTDWFAVEGSVGALENWIHSITDATRVDAVFSNIPLLANVRLQYPNRSPLTPYIGGGVGASVAVLDADHIEIGDTRMHGSAADTVFAYQGFAGLRYKINERMAVDLEYHYIAADSPSWKAEDTFGTATDTLSFGRSETHSVSASFHWSF